VLCKSMNEKSCLSSTIVPFWYIVCLPPPLPYLAKLSPSGFPLRSLSFKF
jgi:hypothetical protein